MKPYFTSIMLTQEFFFTPQLMKIGLHHSKKESWITSKIGAVLSCENPGASTEFFIPSYGLAWLVDPFEPHGAPDWSTNHRQMVRSSRKFEMSPD